MQSLKTGHYRIPRGRGRERRGQGLANLGGRGADGGDRPDDHRPPRWSTPRRPRCRTVRAGGGSVGRPCRAASGRPTCGRWSVVGSAGCGAGSPPSRDSGRARRLRSGTTTDPTPRRSTRDMPASQRGGAAIDSFRPVDRDRGRRCPCSSSATAGAHPGRCGNALHHGGTVLDGRPARFRSRRQDAQALARRDRASRDGAGDHRASCRNRSRRAGKGHWIPAEDEGTSGGTVAGTPELSHLL